MPDSTKKLVFFTANKSCGGAERFVILTAQNLQQNYGWEVYLLCGAWPQLDAWCDEFAAFGGVLRLHYAAPGRWLGRDLPAAFKLLRSANLVHVNIGDQIGKLNLLGVLLAWVARRPVVLSERLVITPEERGHAGWSVWLWRRLARLYHRLASGVVAISTSDRQILVDYYKVAPAKIKIIPVGIDTDLFSPSQSNELSNGGTPAGGLRQSASSYKHANQQLIVCTSRLIAEKGHRFLVEATPAVLKAFPNVRFVLVGEGEAKEELMALVEKQGLAAHFNFTGQLASRQIAELLASAALVVLPSLRESVSRAACEAVATGTPIIVTAVGSMAELIENGVSGWVVPPGDSAALASVIQAALGNPAASRAMAAKARAKLLAEQSLPQTIAATNAFYEGLRTKD